MIHAAAERLEVTYTDRHGTARAGTLVYWPSTTGARRNGARAKVRTPGGHYVTVPTDQVDQPSTLNPRPQVETPDPARLERPSTLDLDPSSRVSVHDFGRSGTVRARDVRGRPERRPPSRQDQGPA